MNPIRAFVGHSFLPGDQAVIRAFTDYLTTLAESLPSFMWQDAERAEPNTLSEKVLRIEDAPVFEPALKRRRPQTKTKKRRRVAKK